MYFSVKTISKSLEDYDHIKLVTEQEPLQVKFEEKPIYRQLIGKLIINHEVVETSLSNAASESKLNLKTTKQKKATTAPSLPHKNNNMNKDASKSLSLNDILEECNNLDNYYQSGKQPSKQTSQDNHKNQQNKLNSYSMVKMSQYPPPAAPPIPPNLFSTSSSSQDLNNRNNKNTMDQTRSKLQQKSAVSILKNNNNNSANNLKSASKESLMRLKDRTIEPYRIKRSPKQRLEIDILPSHLSFSNNRLLIASSYGKIRVMDLFTYKIQKDELKNLIISGICLPKRIHLGRSASSDSLGGTNNGGDKASANNVGFLPSSILYAVTNGVMSEQDDYLNVSNSTIIVTKNELKVLKKDPSGADSNDDYLFYKPSGICFDEYDNIYICDSGYNRVKVLSASTLSLVKTIEFAQTMQDTLSQPKSVCAQNDILYISDSANHRIVTYYILNEGADFKFKSVIGLGYGSDLGMLSYPLECCVDTNSILCVRDHHNNRVQLFNSDGVAFHSIEVNSAREIIYSMTMSESGDIYVAKMVNNMSSEMELEEEKLPKSNGNGSSSSSQDNFVNNGKYYIDIY
jgi:hypothetical protein